MRVRKSLSRPRSTITSKTLNETPKITKKTIKRLKNAVGTAYPPENLVSPDLELEKVFKAANALLTADKSNSEKVNILGGDEGEPIHLSMAFFKIPDIPKRMVRIELPNTLLQDTTDVALIVPNLEKNTRRPDNDMVIQMYTSRLRAHGIKHPIQVITLNQIMAEFKTYESKKHLSNTYDVFLAAGPISGRLVPLLGKHFLKSKKDPIPVKLDPPSKMKESILKALNKTQVQISSKGNCKSIKVAHTGMTAKEIAENVMQAVAVMSKEFPGGWMNVKNLHLKSLRSPCIPFYLAFRNPNDIKITGMKKKIKHGEPVTDELSTTAFEDFQVRVRTDGEVEFVDNEGKSLSKKRQIQVMHDFDMRKKRKYAIEDAKLLAAENEEDAIDGAERMVPENLGSDDDAEGVMDIDPDLDEELPKAKKTKKSKKKAADESDDEEEEAAVRNYEDAYLNELEQETMEKEEKENENVDKQPKVEAKKKKSKAVPKKAKTAAAKPEKSPKKATTIKVVESKAAAPKTEKTPKKSTAGKVVATEKKVADKKVKTAPTVPKTKASPVPFTVKTRSAKK